MSTAESPVEVGADSGIMPPRQKRTRASFDRIQAAAEELLTTTGPENFTMAGVAELADVSVPAIYRRFQGKEDLLAATKASLLESLNDSLEAALEKCGPLIRDVITIYCETLGRELQAHAKLYQVLIDTNDTGALRDVGLTMLNRSRALFMTAGESHSLHADSEETQHRLEFMWRVLTFSLINRASLEGGPLAIDWDEEIERLIDMATMYITAEDES